MAEGFGITILCDRRVLRVNVIRTDEIFLDRSSMVSITPLWTVGIQRR